MKMERKKSSHVVDRCTMLVVMLMLVAAVSVTAAIVTLKSFIYNANTSVKVNRVNYASGFSFDKKNYWQQF